MTNSILGTTKKLLGVDDAYDVYDPDIVMHINSVFLILNQLGVGPSECFSIVDESTTWEDFFDNKELVEMVKTYMYFKVRMAFDPPMSAKAAEAMEKTIAEYEWRLNLNAESGKDENICDMNRII